MIYYDRSLRFLAAGFAALAGFVDAIGFLKSGGLFVSFMSGNSTRLAIGIAETKNSAILAGGLIFMFVLGVTANVLMSARSTRVHRKVAAAASVAALLISAAVAQTAGWNILTVALLCSAMGASNAVFQRDGEVSIGVTYMTGTLVKLGYKLADAIRGQDRTAWAPHLLLWLALVIGGVAGAIIFAKAPTASLWLAAGLGLALLAAAHKIKRGDSPGVVPIKH